MAKKYESFSGKQISDEIFTDGKDLERVAKEVIVQPPDVIDRMKKLLGK